MQMTYYINNSFEIHPKMYEHKTELQHVS